MKRSLLVSFFEIINVIVQFGYLLLWGLFFGARPEMDAFLTSMALPTVLIIVTTGPLISSLVPLLVEQQVAGQAFELQRFKSNLLNLFIGSGLLLSLIFFAGSDWVLRLIAPGLPAGLRLMATDLLRIEICALPLAMVNGILISFHYADEKFYRPTLAPIFGSLAGIGLVVFFHKSLGIHALAWGFCLNNLVQLLILALIVKDHSWKLEWRNEGLRQLGKRILPLTLGNIYYKSDTLVERLIASFLPSGSISYLGYGQRITTAITQVLTRGFITTRFTEMSQTYLQGPDGFRRVFNQLLERISYIIVPVVFAIILFSQDIIHFLLERGAFTAADTRHTALVLIALIGVVIGGMLGSIMANSFYAAGDTRTITIFAMVSFTIGIGLKIVGARLFSFYGIALATSLYFMLTPIIGFTILQRKLKVFAQQKTWRHCVKILLAGAISFLLCFYSLPKTSLGFWLLPLGVSLLFILYQLLAMVLHVDEAWKLWKKVKDYGLHLLLR